MLATSSTRRSAGERGTAFEAVAALDSAALNWPALNWLVWVSAARLQASGVGRLGTRGEGRVLGGIVLVAALSKVAASAVAIGVAAENHGILTGGDADAGIDQSPGVIWSRARASPAASAASRSR